MSFGESIIARAREALDLETYRQQHWKGTFAEYLELVKKNPRVTRTAFERIYDMILDAGTREYIDNKNKIVHYNIFSDGANDECQHSRLAAKTISSQPTAVARVFTHILQRGFFHAIGHDEFHRCLEHAPVGAVRALSLGSFFGDRH